MGKDEDVAIGQLNDWIRNFPQLYEGVDTQETIDSEPHD